MLTPAFVRFWKHPWGSMILTNIAGDFFIIPTDDAMLFLSWLMSEDHPYATRLKGHGFTREDLDKNVLIDRWRKRFGVNFSGPSLHIAIITKGCNQSCYYCHASALPDGDTDAIQMDIKTADSVIDRILESPLSSMTLEFQWGEPLSHFDLIEYMIARCESLRGKKAVNYAIVSNLTLLDEALLERIFSLPNTTFSTSLDGPACVHDAQRVFARSGAPTFDILREKIALFRSWEKKKNKIMLGWAMGVVTGRSLPYVREIIDTYRSLGFNSLFLKKFNPLGYGECVQNLLGISDEEFKNFYTQHLDYLIQLFSEGVFVADEHIRIFAGKIFTPDRVNFMELRSPCGAGIGQIAYNYDGSVYTCDEGRMVDHDLFRLGSVNNTLKELIQNETVATMIDASLLESLPCDLCHYAPYCGVCPILTHAQHHTIYTDQRDDGRCQFFTFLFDWIFDKLQKRDTMAFKYIGAHFPGLPFEQIPEQILSLPS